MAPTVMYLNAQDEGKRKFIMVQLPERTEENSDAYRLGFINICEIGKERIRRAGDKIAQDLGKSNFDIGFKVYKLDTSNIKYWNPDFDNLEEILFTIQDNLLEGRTQEDLLYEILLKQGIDLTAKIEEVSVNGKRLFNVGHGALLIFLANDILLNDVKDIVKYKSSFMDTKVVFRDSGFSDDAVKTNAIQILKQAGIKEDHIRSV